MTMTPKRMLVACDALDRAEPLPPAIGGMARLFESEAVLLNVVPRLPTSRWPWRSVETEELQSSLIRTREEELDRLARTLRGVPTTVEVRVGDPTVEIVKAAVDHGCDLVVLRDDPRLRSAGRSFGTVTMKLMRKCPLPIWAVRMDSERPTRVMAAVDVGPEDGDDNLNTRILTLARQFVTPRAAPLVVLHAWALWGEELLGAPGRMGREELAAAVAQTKGDHERWLHDWLAQEAIAENDVDLQIVKGDASLVVPAMVRDRRIDLLVMGTVARTGLPGLFMGNTAERILHEVTCSVLTVKPDGFVSPIAPPAAQEAGSPEK